MKTPNFNKRHYDAIAGVLKDVYSRMHIDEDVEVVFLTIAVALAAFFRDDNPKFDTTKFLLAAGAKA